MISGWPNYPESRFSTLILLETWFRNRRYVLQSTSDPVFPAFLRKESCSFISYFVEDVNHGHLIPSPKHFMANRSMFITNWQKWLLPFWPRGVYTPFTVHIIQGIAVHLHNNQSAFQLILSSGGSCRPSEGSPRPRANSFRYIQLNTYMSPVGSGSLLRPTSYLEHWPMQLKETRFLYWPAASSSESHDARVAAVVVPFCTIICSWL